MRITRFQSRFFGQVLLVIALAGLATAGPGNEVSFVQAPDAGARADTSGAGQVHLVVLHTNDLHGQVLPQPAFRAGVSNPPLAGGLARIGAYVNRIRREADETGAEVLVLDAGDWSQGTPEGARNQGRDFLMALSRIGYDAMCVGNHEFDHGVDALMEHLAELSLPAVLANVRREDGSSVPFLPSHRVLERCGLRIAVVGLVSSDTPAITHPSAREWKFEEPAAALRALRAELNESVDWILPVTHLGVTDDRQLARAHPDLDLIVGGHSHTRLEGGLLEGSTRIVQAGSKGQAIGRVDVWFDREDGRVVRTEARVIDLIESPLPEDRDPSLEAECRSMLERGSNELDHPVGTLAAPMGRATQRLTSSPAGNLICDAMREASGADIAIQNRGGIRADLYTGVVTRRDLFNVLPFSNHLVVVRLSGRELESCIRRAVEGPGRRGPEVSGMGLTLRRTDDGVRLVELTLAGAPLDPEAQYELATNSFLATGGDGYECLIDAVRVEQGRVLLRDLVEALFQGGDPVRPPTEDRYRFVE